MSEEKQTFRVFIKNLNEKRNYFPEEIKQSELITKRLVQL